MEIILYLIPPSLILGGVIVWALFWSVKNNQFEDLDGAANRILFESDKLKSGKEDERN